MNGLQNLGHRCFAPPLMTGVRAVGAQGVLSLLCGHVDKESGGITPAMEQSVEPWVDSGGT